MRFVDEMKQGDIAAAVGVSQVQVSRLLRQALDSVGQGLGHRCRFGTDERAMSTSPKEVLART
jgi:hypothetical protein